MSRKESVKSLLEQMAKEFGGLERAQIEVEKALSKQSLAQFVRLAWPIVEPGQPYVHGWHIDFICAHLEAITNELRLENGSIYNRLLINIPPGTMKALDSDTPILTIDGWKRHGDLQPGDFVFGPSGAPIRVEACTPEVSEPSYRVIFDDGAEIVAGSGHEWAIEREFVDASTKWRRERRSMIVETPDLMSSASTNGTYRRPDRIPLCDPVWMPKRPLLIDPYLLGCWLGDGGSAGGVLYSSHQDVKHFSQFGIAKKTSDSSSRGQAFYRVTVPDLQIKLRVRGLLKNKHVPDEYLFASYEDRLSLLQGLMDTDGCGIKTGQCTFTNKNKRIADAVVYLAASIGAKPYMSSRYTKLNGKIYGPHYKVDFRAPAGVRIFRLERKQTNVKYAIQERSSYRYVADVVPIGNRVVKCIQVEGGVYLAGHSLVPTHNSLLTNVFWPAWEWGPRGKPHLRYVCAAHKVENLSARDSRRMRLLITSEWYQERWGQGVNLAADQNEKLNFQNTAGGFRIATAIGSLTGIRGDRVICFPHDEIVHTELGPMPIGEIVETKRDVRIWSSRPGSERAELKKISGWHKNKGSPIVEVGLSDGTKFRCTPDHKVWTSFGWVPAASLDSSHMLPRVAVSNRPDGAGRDAIYVGKQSLRSVGFANRESVGACYFRMFCVFPPEIIIRFENIFRKRTPCFATSDLLNYGACNAVSAGETFSGLFAFGNFSGGHSVQFCPRPTLMQRKSAMPFGIGNIFGARSVFEITKSCIASVSVFVSDFLSRPWRPNESQHYNLVHKKLRRPPILVGIETGIALCWRRLHDFFWNGESAAPNSGNNTRLAADASKIAYAIETLETGDRFPIFVRAVGHVDETFCLSVEDHHSFFVGNGKGVLVSNCDDPHSVESASSEAQRESEVTNFLEAIPTRLNDPIKSSIVVIMQRLHQEDVSGVIIEKGLGYDHIMLPMRYDPLRAAPTKLGLEDPRSEEGELLFPQRFPEHVVDRDEKAMGPYATAGQHQQEPAPRGGGVIKRDWWRPWEAAVFPPFDYIVASLDTAYTLKQENDPSAMTVWGVFSGDVTPEMANNFVGRGMKLKNNEKEAARFDQMSRIASLLPDNPESTPRIMLMNAWSERLELPDLIEKVARTCRKFKVDQLLIENKAAGISVGQELRRLYGHEDWAVQLINPGAIDKLARLYAVQHLFSEGIIYAPDMKYADMVVHQCEIFPKGKHDDLVDTTSMALKYLRETGILVRQPERIADIDAGRQHRGKPLEPLY